MEISEYQALANRTAKELPLDKAILHVVVGFADEVGELSSAVKKAEIYNQPWDLENVSEELGDIFWRLAYAANVFGMSLETIARKNIEKLATRFPEGFSDYHAAARLDKGDEIGH